MFVLFLGSDESSCATATEFIVDDGLGLGSKSLTPLEFQKITCRWAIVEFEHAFGKGLGGGGAGPA